MALGDVKNSDSPDDDPGPFFSRGHADARDRRRMICRDSAFDRFGGSVRIPKLLAQLRRERSFRRTPRSGSNRPIATRGLMDRL